MAHFVPMWLVQSVFLFELWQLHQSRCLLPRPFEWPVAHKDQCLFFFCFSCFSSTCILCTTKQTAVSLGSGQPRTRALRSWIPKNWLGNHCQGWESRQLLQRKPCFMYWHRGFCLRGNVNYKEKKAHSLKSLGEMTTCQQVVNSSCFSLFDIPVTCLCFDRLKVWVIIQGSINALCDFTQFFSSVSDSPRQVVGSTLWLRPYLLPAEGLRVDYFFGRMKKVSIFSTILFLFRYGQIFITGCPVYRVAYVTQVIWLCW